jgi:hypothetical protein
MSFVCIGTTGEEIEKRFSRNTALKISIELPALSSECLTKRNQKHHAFACAVRRKERCDVIIEERKPGCAKSECVCGQVELACDNSRLKLCDTVAPVAKACQHRFQVNHEVDVDGGIRAQILAESQIASFLPKVTFPEQFKCLLLLVKHISPLSESIDSIDNQVEVA